MTGAEPNRPTRPCIVAGFDNSPSGFDAVALGRQLAAVTDARLIVAHVYLDVISAIDVVPPPELVAERRRHALVTVGRASIVLDGFEHWEPVVHAAEPPARGLHEIAERAAADLIVVGSTHRHGLGRVMPGTTGERLIHGSGRAIAIAPAGWHGDAVGTIGAGFDGTAESRAALEAAATLARASGASLRVMSVFEAPHPANPVFAVTGHGYGEITGELRRSRQRQLDEALAELPSGVDADGEIVDGHPAHALAAESHRLDLLVIGSRGYGALRATMAGGVAHQLAATSHCPLLLVPRGVDRPFRGFARDMDREALRRLP